MSTIEAKQNALRARREQAVALGPRELLAAGVAQAHGLFVMSTALWGLAGAVACRELGCVCGARPLRGERRFYAHTDCAMQDDFAVMHRLLSEASSCAKANRYRHAAEALRRLAALAVTVAVTLEMRRGR